MPGGANRGRERGGSRRAHTRETRTRAPRIRDGLAPRAAIRTGRAELLSALLAAGADPHEPVREQTALDAAASFGSVEALRVIAADPRTTTAHLTAVLPAAAMADEGREKIDVLLERGADPHETPVLVRACGSAGRREMVLRLLDAGARADVADADGCTPLHAAVTAGADEIVEVLLARGASADVPTRRAVRDLDLRKGETARDAAVRSARFHQQSSAEAILRALGVPVREVARFCAPHPPDEEGCWMAAAAYAAANGDRSASNRATEPSCREDVAVDLGPVRRHAKILEHLGVDLAALCKPAFRPGTWTLRRVEVDGEPTSLKKWLRGKAPPALEIAEDGTFRAALRRRKLEGTWRLTDHALVLEDRAHGVLESELDHEGIVISEWSDDDIVTRCLFALR